MDVPYFSYENTGKNENETETDDANDEDSNKDKNEDNDSGNNEDSDNTARSLNFFRNEIDTDVFEWVDKSEVNGGDITVSYTHLTLPTKDGV